MPRVSDVDDRDGDPDKHDDESLPAEAAGGRDDRGGRDAQGHGTKRGDGRRHVPRPDRGGTDRRRSQLVSGRQHGPQVTVVPALKSRVSGRACRTSRRRDVGSGPGSRRSTGLREPRLYPLVDFCPDALDQALGDRVLVTGTEVGVRAHGSADLGLGVAAHERTLQRAGNHHK
jgi:hypothetical protein